MSNLALCIAYVLRLILAITASINSNVRMTVLDKVSVKLAFLVHVSLVLLRMTAL